MLRGVVLVVALSACGRVGFDENTRGVGTDDANGSGSNDANESAAFFTDGFERPADDMLGNGWIEKTPSTFRIQGGVVRRDIVGDWTTNQVYRAASEDMRDIEVSIEFAVLDITLPDWPQVFVRGNPAAFAGYYVWLESGPSNSGTLVDIARKETPASWWTGLAQMTAPSASPGELYRLRLRAVGANPVVLDAWYERSTTSGWIEILHLTAMDSAPEAITDPGTWGFDGHTGTSTGPYTYDNFTATAI